MRRLARIQRWRVSVAGRRPCRASSAFPAAKNPTDLLSGDQNGYEASSVPASGCAETDIQRPQPQLRLPISTWPQTRSVFASGEIANEIASFVGGVVISRRVSGGITAQRGPRAMPRWPTAAISARTTATPHATRSRVRETIGAAAGTAVPTAGAGSRRASSISIRAAAALLSRRVPSFSRAPAEQSPHAVRRVGRQRAPIDIAREARRPLRPTRCRRCRRSSGQ